MSELHSVVLTGMGVITAHGDRTLRDPGVPTPDAPPAALTIDDFKIENYLTSQKTYLDRCAALALAGCALALLDAAVEWPLKDEAAARFGITVGTHLGCIQTMETFWSQATERGVRLANALLFSHSYFNTPISLCAIEFGLKGYHTTCCAGRQSGLESVRAAHDAIRLGHAEAMLCGGVEAVTPMRGMCEGDTGLGEAAAFFVLESAAHAARRTAPVMRDFNDEMLTQAGARRDTIRRHYGDCGGAESALCLAEEIIGHNRAAGRPGTGIDNRAVHNSEEATSDVD